MYIYHLPYEVQEAIREGLENIGISEEDLETTLSSKLYDMDEPIDFGFWD